MPSRWPAFRSRCFWAHRLSVAHHSYPFPRLRAVVQCHTPAVRSNAIPLPCVSRLSHAIPCPCVVNLCPAMPFRGAALDAKHCRSFAFQCKSAPLRRLASRFVAIALRRISAALLICAVLGSALAASFEAGPWPCGSRPFPCQSVQPRTLPLRVCALRTPRRALPWLLVSARLIACAGQSLVKKSPTQPSAFRGRPLAQGAGWLMIRRTS